MTFPIQIHAFTTTKKPLAGAKILLNGKPLGRTDDFGTFSGAWKGRVGQTYTLKLIGPGQDNHLTLQGRLSIHKTKHGPQPTPLRLHAFLRRQ